MALLRTVDTWQRLDDANSTHLVLASGKLVLQKKKKNFLVEAKEIQLFFMSSGHLFVALFWLTPKHTSPRMKIMRDSDLASSLKKKLSREVIAKRFISLLCDEWFVMQLCIIGILIGMKLL